MTPWPINWRALVDEAVRRRKAEGMTQSALATLAGVSRPTVVAFEQGEINLRLERVVAILDALGLIIQHGRADSLQSFIFDARRRFEELTRHLGEKEPARQPFGHSEQAYAIDGIEHVPSLSKLRDILSQAPRTSGWPPFWIPTREGLKPGFQDGLLEGWLGKPDVERVFADAAHSDFWRVARHGTAYLRRGYQEDGRDLEAGTFFDLRLPVWRTAEILLHAIWVARELGAGEDSQIRYSARYIGLAGRELINWAKPTQRLVVDERHRARADMVELTMAANIAEIEKNLDRIVAETLAPLYERFDGYVMAQSLVGSQIAELGAYSDS